MDPITKFLCDITLAITGDAGIRSRTSARHALDKHAQHMEAFCEMGDFLLTNLAKAFSGREEITSREEALELIETLTILPSSPSLPASDNVTIEKSHASEGSNPLTRNVCSRLANPLCSTRLHLWSRRSIINVRYDLGHYKTSNRSLARPQKCEPNSTDERGKGSRRLGGSKDNHGWRHQCSCFGALQARARQPSNETGIGSGDFEEADGQEAEE
jgi:hypothetical protein